MDAYCRPEKKHESKFSDMMMSFNEDKIGEPLLWATKNLSREEMDLFGGDMEMFE